MNSFKPTVIYFVVFVIYFLVLLTSAAFAQSPSNGKVVITGVRFAYPLVEKWIQEYKTINPEANIVIESRTISDPAKYDLLLEAYEPDQATKDKREYAYIGRYAILPVANSSSEFAHVFSKKGLTNSQLKNLFFHDNLADKKKEDQIQLPHTIYTRLQKAGAPITFATYFGYQQQNINGTAIAGADEHLIKAVLKDTIGVTYAGINLIFDLNTRQTKEGVTIIPVDQNGDGRINDQERNISSLDGVLNLLEQQPAKNIPIAYLHLSVAKENSNPDAVKFLEWVIDNGHDDLHQFGFLLPDQKQIEKGKRKI